MNPFIQQLINTNASGAANVVVVKNDHFFADITERNAYFTANPTELRDGIIVSVGANYEERENGVWVDVTAIMQGPRGLKGDKGDPGESVVGPKGDMGEQGPPGTVNNHTHTVTDITEDENHRFVSDAEKTEWSAKVDENKLQYSFLVNAKLNVPAIVTPNAANGFPQQITESGIGTGNLKRVTDISYNTNNDPIQIDVRLRQSDNTFLYGVRKTYSYNTSNQLTNMSSSILSS